VLAYGWYYNNAREDCLTWMDCYQNSPVRYQPAATHSLIIGGEGCAWELQPTQVRPPVQGGPVDRESGLVDSPLPSNSPHDIESGPGGLTREVETPLPSNSPRGIERGPGGHTKPYTEPYAPSRTLFLTRHTRVCSSRI
jgi:hypothetical protein